MNKLKSKKCTFTVSVVLLAYLLLINGNACAETTADAPSAEHPSTQAIQAGQRSYELAKEISQISYDDTYRDRLEARSDSYKVLILRDNPNQGDLISKVIRDYYVPAFMIDKDEFERISTEIYAKNFTEAELQSILDFMRSPVGKKLHALTPELLRQGNAEGRTIKAQAGQDAIQSLIEGLKTNNLNVPKEIGVWKKDK